MYFFKGSHTSSYQGSEGKRKAPIKGPCFADKANKMILALIVFCGLVLFASTTTTLQHYKERRAQTVSFNPCSYCRGMLDKLRRCNIRGCSLFSPDWGKGAVQPVHWRFRM